MWQPFRNRDTAVCYYYGDGVGNAIEENSGVFYLTDSSVFVADSLAIGQQNFAATNFSSS